MSTTINKTKETVLTQAQFNARETAGTLTEGEYKIIGSPQAEITSTNKLSADLIADGTTNIIPTATDETNWNAKQVALVSNSYVSVSGSAITNLAVDYKNTSGTSLGALKFVKCTQAEYDALSTPDANTFYIIYTASA